MEKFKVALVLNEAPRHSGRLEDYFHAFFTSELDGDEWSATSITPGEIYSGTTVSEVGGPQTLCGCCGGENNLLLSTGIEP
jgi:hypothetical protein